MNFFFIFFFFLEGRAKGESKVLIPQHLLGDGDILGACIKKERTPTGSKTGIRIDCQIPRVFGTAGAGGDWWNLWEEGFDNGNDTHDDFGFCGGRSAGYANCTQEKITRASVLREHWIPQIHTRAHGGSVGICRALSPVRLRIEEDIADGCPGMANAITILHARIRAQIDPRVHPHVPRPPLQRDSEISRPALPSDEAL